MNTSEILNAAADLIEPKGRWTQGCMARDITGARTNAFGPEAVAWCAEGAIRVAAARCQGTDLVAGMATADLMRAVGQTEHFVLWNDCEGRTQAEVVQALRDAAKAAS